MEDHSFCYKVFWGDEEKRSHVEFSRRGLHYCIYCGEESDSREHCPSRVFLSKPYPDNLPVLPACSKCNNGFSKDESFVARYIDSLIYLSGSRSDSSLETEKSEETGSAFLQAKKDWEDYQRSRIFPTNNSIIRILTKLSIGHMVYELSEGYKDDDYTLTLKSVEYKFPFQMGEDEIASYDYFVYMSDKILPELGSRVFDRVYVIEAVPHFSVSPVQIRTPIVVMDWNDIQDGRYSYIAWFENDGCFRVKIKINDFLFANLVFSQEGLIED